MTFKISQSLIDKYSAGPPDWKVTQTKNLHENIRKALENSDGSKFDTFLQGSYRNNTAIKEINDVDIVALYDPWSSPESDGRWNWLFEHIVTVISRSSLVSGRVELGDKCVKVLGPLNADIVPAISRSPYSSTDPIKVYSRRDRAERDNYPRTHRQNGVTKQSRTDDTYKATVRMFKTWARQYETMTAPSFYIECAVHSVKDSEFNTYLPLSFASVAMQLIGYTENTVIQSVAGDKDILTRQEWRYSDFADFQSRLQDDVPRVLGAIRAETQAQADAKWRGAFGDF